MASVVIDIASEFTGKKAFSKAETATKSLTKSVKGLAGAFGIAFGARGAMQAVKAFADDDKAAKVLSKTLNNLGLAFADPAVKTFISDLEKQYGILDDKLRPAYQMLLTSTGDYLKSQDLLRTSLDLSAMSGVDVVSVAADLSKAYQGNTRGLMKYQLGLTKAQLAAMSFEEILAQVAKVSSGQAQVAADSYSGSLDKLSVAGANASEILGKSLVDALTILGGAGGLPQTLGLIESISGAIGTAIIGFAKFIRVLDIVTGSGAFNMLGDLNKAFAEFEAQDKARAAAKFAGTGMATSYQGKKAQEAAAAKAAADAKKRAADAKKRAAEALALQNKTLKSQQAALKLAKAKSVFDLTKISIEAALKGKITEEERARLLLMKAIADENVEMIDKYTKALADAQAKTKELQTLLDKVKSTKIENPVGSAFYAGMSAAEITLENFKEGGGFRLKWDATDYYKGLSQSQSDLEKFKEKGGFRLGFDGTDFYAGLAAAAAALAELAAANAALNLGGGADALYDQAVAAAAAAAAALAAANAAAAALAADGSAGLADSTGADGSAGDGIQFMSMGTNTNVPGLNYNPSQNADQNYTNNVINISAGVVGSEDVIVNAVQNALNELARRGNSITYAGAISG